MRCREAVGCQLLRLPTQLHGRLKLYWLESWCQRCGVGRREEREKIQEPGWWESRVNIYACRRRGQVWELLPGGGKHNSGGLFCQVYGVIPFPCVSGCEFRNK